MDLKPSVEGADIYYTTDGTDPRLYGKLYTDTLQLPLSFSGVNIKCYSAFLPVEVVLFIQL